ncbi:MAG: hypothetical protein PHP32_02630 [Candidatus Izemoplasmatales bacterium]|nr:hypothetical protein [Candidatus Izemoplasmatales bacterium]
MTNSYGYDFSNIRTVRMIRQNHAMSVIFFALLLTPLLLFLIFGSLYVFHVPMTDNGYTMNPGDPSYESFFRYFLYGSGLATLALLIPAILSMRKGQETKITLDYDIDLQRIIYVEMPKKTIYIGPKAIITLHLKTGRVQVDRNESIIQEKSGEFVFWTELNRAEHVKVGEKNGNITLRYRIRTHSGLHSKFFRLRINSSGVFEGYREVVSTSRYGNNSVSSMSNYRLEGINIQRPITMDATIRREIEKL